MSQIKELFESLDSTFIDLTTVNDDIFTYQSSEVEITKTLTLTFPIKLAGSTLTYSFTTRLGNIQFAVKFRDEKKREKDILLPAWHDSDKKSIEGKFVLPEPGAVLFYWENSKQFWAGSRRLTYNIEIRQETFRQIDEERSARATSLLPKALEEKDLLLVGFAQKHKALKETSLLQEQIEIYQTKLKGLKKEKAKATEKVNAAKHKLEIVKERILGLSIRCLEAKLLRRIFSFLDPDFSQQRDSTIFSVCKYWRSILTHKSLAKAGRKKPVAKQMVIGSPQSVAKTKRSKFHDMLRLDSFQGKLEIEEHKKKLQEIAQKQQEEEAKIINEYERADEEELRRIELEAFASKQKKMREKELELAASEFFRNQALLRHAPNAISTVSSSAFTPLSSKLSLATRLKKKADATVSKETGAKDEKVKVQAKESRYDELVSIDDKKPKKEKKQKKEKIDKKEKTEKNDKKEKKHKVKGVNAATDSRIVSATGAEASSVTIHHTITSTAAIVSGSGGGKKNLSTIRHKLGNSQSVLANSESVPTTTAASQRELDFNAAVAQAEEDLKANAASLGSIDKSKSSGVSTGCKHDASEMSNSSVHSTRTLVAEISYAAPESDFASGLVVQPLAPLPVPQPVRRSWFGFGAILSDPPTTPRPSSSHGANTDDHIVTSVLDLSSVSDIPQAFEPAASSTPLKNDEQESDISTPPPNDALHVLDAPFTTPSTTVTYKPVVLMADSIIGIPSIERKETMHSLDESTRSSSNVPLDGNSLHQRKTEVAGLLQSITSEVEGRHCEVETQIILNSSSSSSSSSSESQSSSDSESSSSSDSDEEMTRPKDEENSSESEIAKQRERLFAAAIMLSRQSSRS